jgi:hypothetical protein
MLPQTNDNPFGGGEKLRLVKFRKCDNALFVVMTVCRPNSKLWRACRAIGRNNRRGHMNGRYAGVPTNSRSSGIPRSLVRSA